MLGAAWAIAPLAPGGTFGGLFRNHYSYVFRRAIDGKMHGMANGEIAWLPYVKTHLNLRSVANGGHVEDGNDHRFELANGVLVRWELESWNASTGAIVAWVRLIFQKDRDLVLHHYYGKAAVAAPEHSASDCWSGWDLVVDLSTGLDKSGHGRSFTLTGVTPATLLGTNAGDFG